MKKLADTTKDSAVAEQAAAVDEEAAKAPTPGGAERALEHDNKRSDAYKAALAKRRRRAIAWPATSTAGRTRPTASRAGRSCGSSTARPTSGHDSDRVADVRFGTGSFDNQRVVFEAGGLSPRNATRSASPGGTSTTRPASSRCGWPPARAAARRSCSTRRSFPRAWPTSRPTARRSPSRPGSRPTAHCEIIFRNEAAPNAIVSEIWLWESATDAGSPAGPKP